jgi:hypothetical protein
LRRSQTWCFENAAQGIAWLLRHIDQVKETTRTVDLIESLVEQMENAPDSELRSFLTEPLITAEGNEEIRVQACRFRAEEWATDCDRRSLALRKEAAKQKRKLGPAARPEEPHGDVFPIAEEQLAFWKLLRAYRSIGGAGSRAGEREGGL